MLHFKRKSTYAKKTILSYIGRSRHVSQYNMATYVTLYIVHKDFISN